MNISDDVGVPRVMQFICWKLEGYDCSKLRYVRLVALQAPWVVNGWVRFSRIVKHNDRVDYENFRIRGAVNPGAVYPVAIHHEVRKPDAFNGSHTFQNVRGILPDKETAAMLVLSHEIAHFLLLTKQWPLRNCEGNANWIAYKWIDEFLGRKWSEEDVFLVRRRVDMYAHEPLF